MTVNADKLDIQDVHPEGVAPVAEPAEVSDTPAAEPKETVPEPSPAPTDKAQQPTPIHQIPKWRLDEVLEQNRQLKAQLQQGQPRQEVQQPIAQQPAPDAPVAPKEEAYATWDEFRQAEKEYYRAEARFQARQEFARAKQEEQQHQQTQSFQERVRKAEESFGEKLNEATLKNPALLDKLRNAPMLRNDLAFYGLKESDQPMALAEHLADNPALVLQLNQMPPERALREMGKIEAKLTAVTGGPQKKPSAQVPNLDPVGGGNQPVRKNPYSSQSSEEEYIAGTRRRPG